MNKKNIENIYPLSPMQQGILFHTLNAPESGVYVIQTCYTLKKNLNVPAFKQAWQQIVDRHSVFRTSFYWKQHQEPFQVVHKKVPLSWQEYDWSQLSASEQQEKLEAFLQADRKQGFDLSQASQMRLSFIYLANDTYQFIWSNHHIILDGWSVALVLKDVITAYQSLCSGQYLPTTRTRPYSDYIAWLKQQDLSQAETFWRKQLKGFAAPTPLPITNYVASLSEIETDYEEQSFKLSTATTAALQSLARQHKLTINTLVQGTWALLLSRYSGEEDVVFGATSSGRPPQLIGAESMVGLFINTLPVRVQVSGSESLIPWLQKLQARQVEAQQYEYSPLVEVQGWSEVPRNLPLFESILVFENYPVDASLAEWAKDLEIREVYSQETTNYPITIAAAIKSELSFAILYDRQRFEDTTITRMLGHLKTLLEGIAANPHRSLSSLPLLTQAELQQLQAWNHNQTDYPKFQCIHQLFEQQVIQTPDAIAVICSDRHLTYQELNQRANQLARYLQTLGVEPEVLVGICVERSLEMVVGLLGILKAGGAYVPLDPNYPQERLRYILADSGVEVLLSQQSLLKSLPSNTARVVCLDRDWETIEQYSQENPDFAGSWDNLAYGIYTSGSTGQPKGVMITHRALSCFIQTALSEYKIAPSDRILQFASISFDAAVEEIYPCLSAGATLVLRTNEMLADLQKFFQACRDLHLTVLDLPTAYWHQLVADLASADIALPESLRLVIIGGEKVLREPVKSWQQYVARLGKKDRLQLINTYGPTETTVSATLYRIQPGNSCDAGEIPIGRPLGHLQAYILDSNLQPVPIGIAGELYIGGDSLARGYLNRPELTSEKFIPNPFEKSEVGSRKSEVNRIYKTGDLARYLSDGNIEFLGRTDNQVKIRGFRIEPGEIEAVISQHPAVGQAVVTVREDLTKEKRIVVYFVLKPDATATVSDLRGFLQKHLPDYMVPSIFVLMETLPLTANGKVDRKALPTPNLTPSSSEEVYEAPRTPLEKQLAEIWAEVLGVERVGINDNFFELGGHSLLIVRLLARIHAVFKIDLPLQTLFGAPTVASLAQRLEINTPLTEPILDLKAEAVLDPAIQFTDKSIELKTEPTSIFLTGATGFLGAFLLSELLEQTQADIYCLVRSPNTEEGKNRIRQHLKSYLLWDESQSKRIIPVIGDLSQPLLGLSQAQFDAIANKLDVIYHNGAWVHHASPYFTLKAANVLGTQEVLRLASQSTVKPVHFISTISVFSLDSTSGIKIIREDSSIDYDRIPDGGYTQSKWVAEKLVSIARDRGLPVYIYRPGAISGHSQTGVFNPNDFLYKLLIGCIELGSIPEGNFSEGLAPVDYVADAIVHLSRQETSIGKAFHLLNPDLLDLGILFKAVRSFGYPLKQISRASWQAELKNIAQNLPEHPLYPLVPLLSSQSDDLWEKTSNSAVIKFDCQNTLAGLAGSSIVCPPTDENLLRTYLNYLIHSLSQGSTTASNCP